METTSKSSVNSLFDMNKCLAKMYDATGLVDCHTPEQMFFCGYLLSFGSAYFCTHPQKKEFVERMLKLQNAPGFRPSEE